MHQCVCLCMWDLLWRTKKGVKKLPLVAKCGTSFVLYVCLYVNTFNYLTCCHSVCGSVLTGIVIEFLCQYWSADSGILSHFTLSSWHQTQPMPSSPVNCLIDKSRLSMLDYKARFILNPTKMVWFRLFLCEREKKNRTGEMEGVQSVCVFSYILYYITHPFYKINEYAQGGKYIYFSQM